MDRNPKQNIIDEIEEIERRIKSLKLKLTEEKSESKTEKGDKNLRPGDKARILNPNRLLGQETEGFVVKVNNDTKRVTVEGKRFKVKVVRHINNVVKINEFSK